MKEIERINNCLDEMGQRLEKLESGDKKQKRFKLWLNFWKFVLGTVALSLIATILSHQIKIRETELKEQEQLVVFVEHALEEDVGLRKRFAEYFSTVTRSNKLRSRWKEYARLVEEEYKKKETEKEKIEEELKKNISGQERTRLMAEIEKLNSELEVKPSRSLSPRIYFHIAKESQRESASFLERKLEEKGFTIPGIQKVTSAPNISELRYFRMSEEYEASIILKTLKEGGLNVQKKYIPGYETSKKIRDRHYELWLSKDDF